MRGGGRTRSLRDVDERVFIYVRLRIGKHVLARTKIREFAGLGSLLADFLRSTMSDGVDLSQIEITKDDSPVMEYVDAASEAVLIAFRVDLQRQEQVVAGKIPPHYRRRMLDPQVSSFSSDRFVERAAPDLSPEKKEALAEWLVKSRFDLLARIKDAMDDEGQFEVHLPLERDATDA